MTLDIGFWLCCSLLSCKKSDYEDIDSVYGTLDHVDELISELKKRNMRLVMDMVFNHTSDQVRLRSVFPEN